MVAKWATILTIARHGDTSGTADRAVVSVHHGASHIEMLPGLLRRAGEWMQAKLFHHGSCLLTGGL